MVANGRKVYTQTLIADGTKVYIQKHSEITRYLPTHATRFGGKVGTAYACDFLPDHVSVDVVGKGFVCVRYDHLRICKTAA